MCGEAEGAAAAAAGAVAGAAAAGAAAAEAVFTAAVAAAAAAAAEGAPDAAAAASVFVPAATEGTVEGVMLPPTDCSPVGDIPGVMPPGKRWPEDDGWEVNVDGSGDIERQWQTKREVEFPAEV